MAVSPRVRPAHWVVLALALAPAWKLVQWAARPGPKRVTARDVAAGRALFQHEWTRKDPLSRGDGLGPVFNARSCVECHSQGGAGGGGGVERNVTLFGLEGERRAGLPPSGVVHARAVEPGFQETLDQLSASLPHAPAIPLAELVEHPRRLPPGVKVTQRNTPALFGDGLIDVIPDETLIAHMRQRTTAARLIGLNQARDPKVRGRIARLPDGRIGRFGWKLEFASLDDFVRAACANEIGLSNPGRPQATPLGKPGYRAPGDDLSEEQCVQIADFIRGLPAPEQVWPSSPQELDRARRGQAVFGQIGCADCHVRDIGPVAGIYSDNLLHDMGDGLESATGTYGSTVLGRPSRNEHSDEGPPTAGEWRTAPLWGVADSAPYLHDGRAATLEEAVEDHGGEASGVVGRFKAASSSDRDALVSFLKTLRAPGVSSGRPDASVATR